MSDLFLVDVNIAAITCHKPNDHVEAGRLSRSVRPQQTNDLATTYFDGYVCHHRSLFVALIEGVRRERAFGVFVVGRFVHH